MKNSDIVVSYLNAFATGDPDAIAKHVTDDFENIQVSELGAGCIGIDTYRQRLAGFLASFENLIYTVDELIVDRDKVAVAYTMTFTDNGCAVEIEGAMILTIRSNRIAIRKDYWDGLSYQKQVERP